MFSLLIYHWMAFVMLNIICCCCWWWWWFLFSLIHSIRFSVFLFLSPPIFLLSFDFVFILSLNCIGPISNRQYVCVCACVIPKIQFFFLFTLFIIFTLSSGLKHISFSFNLFYVFYFLPFCFLFFSLALLCVCVCDGWFERKVCATSFDQGDRYFKSSI